MLNISAVTVYTMKYAGTTWIGSAIIFHLGVPMAGVFAITAFTNIRDIVQIPYRAFIANIMKKRNE